MLVIEIGGDIDLSKALDSLEKSFEVNHILDEAASYLLSQIRSRFLQQVSADGTPWIPSFAAMRRAAEGRGGGTLFDTGKLFHSIQLAGQGTDERFIATNVEYAYEHNYGTEGQVRREYMGINEEDVEMVERIIYARIARLLG